MNRIVEAFTRPHYQVSAIDELIVAATVLALIGIVALIAVLLTK